MGNESIFTKDIFRNNKNVRSLGKIMKFFWETLKNIRIERDTMVMDRNSQCHKCVSYPQMVEKIHSKPHEDFWRTWVKNKHDICEEGNKVRGCILQDIEPYKVLIIKAECSIDMGIDKLNSKTELKAQCIYPTHTRKLGLSYSSP